jgi:uncharacterized protein (DUF1015 family)
MQIKPFRAYRYDPSIVGNDSDCIAPPYDVIDADTQEALYQKNEYNIVRVIKGKTKSTDDDRENQYTRAADTLNNWILNGALKQDEEPSIYGYVQNFDISGVPFARKSFIALSKIEDFGKVVKPHEQILSKPMLDRLNLKRATKARFGLVFMLYTDETNTAETVIDKAMTVAPLVDMIDSQDVRHRLYVIPDQAGQDAIVTMMADKSCIIADGHHRYTTGLKFSQELNTPEAQYQMGSFANTNQEGLVVLATHRLVNNLKNFDTSTLINALKGCFDIAKWTFDDAQSKQDALQTMLAEMRTQFEMDRSACGIYTANGVFYVATLKARSAMDKVAADKSEAWRHLDVSILHKLILEKTLGINEEKLAQGGYVAYVKDTPTAIDDSIALVDNGDKQAAFFTNPVRIEQLNAVTDVGERMPQKSTYFYPKMFTGLTIQKL